MLDRAKIGEVFPTFVVPVETGRLRFFAKSIGEKNPIYTDESAARDAGYKALPAPPTFPMVLDMESDTDLPPEVEVLKMDVGRILHGSQEFEYFGQVYAGDDISVSRKLVDVFDKKNGALEFVVTETSYTNQEHQLLAKARCTLVYRNA